MKQTKEHSNPVECSKTTHYSFDGKNCYCGKIKGGETKEQSKEVEEKVDQLFDDAEKAGQYPFDRESCKEFVSEATHNAVAEERARIAEDMDWRNWGLGNTPYDSDILDNYEKHLQALKDKTN